MARTNIRGTQINDDTIQREDLCVDVANHSVITKIIAGTGIGITQTGTDTGTGDVTVNISTPITIAQGGTGQTVRQDAINALTNVSAATNEWVLTKDTATGNAIFKANSALTLGTLDAQGKTANGATITSGVLYLQTADATNVGLITSGTQALGGNKTLNGSLALTVPTASYDYSSEQLGAEKCANGNFDTNASWTFGAGWSWDGTNFEADHASGTAALEQNCSITIGKIYKVTFTISNWVSGNVSPFLGAPAAQAYTNNYGANGTASFYRVAKTTGNLQFVPSSNFVGSIDSVSVKEVLVNPNPLFKIGVGGFEFREGGVSSTYNVAIGTNAGYNFNLAGSASQNNVAIGLNALRYSYGTQYAVAIGYNNLSNATEGSSYVTAVGAQNLTVANYINSVHAFGSGNLSSLLAGGNMIALGQNNFTSQVGATGGNYYITALGWSNFTSHNSTDNQGIIAIGNSLGSNATAMQGVTAIGSNSGRASVLYSSIIVGKQCGNLYASGSQIGYSVIIGNSAVGSGSYTTNGNFQYSVVIGDSAFHAVTSQGSYSVIIGANAYKNVLAGGQYGCVVIGYNAIGQAQTGTSNTVIGYTAAQNVPVLSNSTIVGYQILAASCISATDVCLFGDNAAYQSYFAQSPCAFGNQALQGSKIILGSTAIGNASLQNLTPKNGTINSFADAGGGQTTVTSNNHGLADGTQITIFYTTSYNGTFTISGSTTNTYNITRTFVANDAQGYWYQTGQASGVTALGYSSGYNITTGKQGVYLGYQAGASSTANGIFDNQIAIGYVARSYNLSNTVVLGNGSITNWLPGGDNVVDIGIIDGTNGHRRIKALNTVAVKIWQNTSFSYTFNSVALTANRILTFPDSSGTSGQVLQTDGSGVLTWVTPGGGIGTLNTLTATTQTFATGTSGTDFNISSATSTHTFNIPDASATARGLVTVNAQTFAGDKTFSGDIILSSKTASSTLVLDSNKKIQALANGSTVSYALSLYQTLRTLQGSNGTLTLEQVADVLCTLINDLKNRNVIS